MADLHDVSIVDDVFLAFKPKQSLFLKGLMAAVLHEIIVMAHFRTDEMFLQVGVNHARGTLGVRALRNRPRTALFFANSEK